MHPVAITLPVPPRNPRSSQAGVYVLVILVMTIVLTTLGFVTWRRGGFASAHATAPSTGAPVVASAATAKAASPPSAVAAAAPPAPAVVPPTPPQTTAVDVDAGISEPPPATGRKARINGAPTGRGAAGSRSMPAGSIRL